MGILSFLFPPDPPTQEAPWKLIKDSYISCEGIPSSYTVIDLETSGLDPRHSEILEIGAIKYRDGTETGRYHTFVRPVGRIPSSASSVNGLTWRKLHSEPLLDDVQDAFFSFIGDDVLVGHNIGFDITFVQTRFGVNLENKCFDTLEWSRLAFQNLQSYKLDSLRTYFTLGGEAHSALGDCVATHNLLERIRNAGIKTQTRDSDQGSRRPANNALYEKARQYWQKGEDERKSGNYDRAIELFDYARSLGLNSPFIYESYAMVYRKLKDYEKEISILDEGISCLPSDETEFLQVRRNRAETLWTAQKNRELELQEKAQKRELRAIKKQEEDTLRAENPKRAAKRPVLQCDEEGHVIKEFESVTAAAIECKISTKSIRAAANGLQNMPVGFAGNMQIEKYKGFGCEIVMNKNYFPVHIWLFNYLLEHGIPEKEAEYAVNRITNSVRQLDSACCDNFRVSVNGENADRYETIRSMGCCGFFDDEITLKSGNVIKYGFNYGH